MLIYRLGKYDEESSFSVRSWDYTAAVSDVEYIPVVGFGTDGGAFSEEKTGEAVFRVFHADCA